MIEGGTEEIKWIQEAVRKGARGIFLQPQKVFDESPGAEESSRGRVNSGLLEPIQGKWKR